MPRRARVLIERGVYHVYNRVARGEPVFVDLKGATFTIAPLADRVHVIQNWFEELKGLGPTE